MQNRIAGALVAASLLVAGAVLVRGVSRGLVSDGRELPQIGRGPNKGGIPESYFKFSPVVKGGGDSGAPDWQVASATMTFSDLDSAAGPDSAAERSWTCHVTVGLPLRTEKWGEVAPEYAAYTAAVAATDSANAVKGTAGTGDFCKRWRDGIRQSLDHIEGLGAEVGGSDG
jgi:hypothetical protein